MIIYQRTHGEKHKPTGRPKNRPFTLTKTQTKTMKTIKVSTLLKRVKQGQIEINNDIKIGVMTILRTNGQRYEQVKVIY